MNGELARRRLLAGALAADLPSVMMMPVSEELFAVDGHAPRPMRRGGDEPAFRGQPRL